MLLGAGPGRAWEHSCILYETETNRLSAEQQPGIIPNPNPSPHRLRPPLGNQNAPDLCVRAGRFILWGILPINRTKDTFWAKSEFSTSREMNGLSVECLKCNFIHSFRPVHPGSLGRALQWKVNTWDKWSPRWPNIGKHPSAFLKPSSSLFPHQRLTAPNDSTTTLPSRPRSPYSHWSSLLFDHEVVVLGTKTGLLGEKSETKEGKMALGKTSHCRV